MGSIHGFILLNVNSSSLAYLNYIFNVKRELNENELNSVKFILIKRNKKGELID